MSVASVGNAPLANVKRNVTTCLSAESQPTSTTGPWSPEALEISR